MTEAPEATVLPQAAAAGQALIVTREVAKRYRVGQASVSALDGISLCIEKGEFLAIVGPSGSGKSTLLNILGLIEDVSAGELYIGGRLASRLSERQRAALRLRSIGFVFQTFNLLPNLTALQNVALPLRLAGVGRKQRKERALELLASVGLSQRMSHTPMELSGGERQRVAIARALANGPSIVLADEPTGNLDSANGKEIIAILSELNRAGQTIVMVTHDSEVSMQAGRLLRLRDGRILPE